MDSSSEQPESQPKKLKSSAEDGEACPTAASGAGDTASKGSGDGHYHKLAISPVVQVHWLAECVPEADLVKAIAKFGTICYVTMMPSMRQALVEFENTEFSKLCVTSTKNEPILLGGQPALFNYSTSKKITRPAKTVTSSESGTNVLLVSIYDATLPISVDIIYSVFNPVGKVNRIVIFRRNTIKAMVEFETVLDAQRARAILNGTNLFKGCGTLSIEYARPTRLNVIRNNNDSWDYSISSMNTPDQGKEPQMQGFQDQGNGPQRQGFQGNQAQFQNQGNGPQMQGFQGNQPFNNQGNGPQMQGFQGNQSFNNQGNGPQRQGFQGNQGPFQNQGNGPQRQGFQGNQPFNNQGNGPQRQGFQGNQGPFPNQGNGPQRQGFQGNQGPFPNQGNGPQQRQGFQGNQPPFPNQGNGPQRQGFQGNQGQFQNQGNGPQQRQGFQGNQGPFPNQGNGPQRQGFQGNQAPFQNQGNGPQQRQGFQGNQGPFPNQGNGPQRQGFQGNQPPFNNQGNGPQRQGFQGNQAQFQNQGNGPQQRQGFQGNQGPFPNQGNGPQQRQGFQGNQGPFQNQGNGPQRQGFQGNQPSFQNQGNGPQMQGFQGNQPPFQNQGNGPQRQGFQGNQPPFPRFDGYDQGYGPQRQDFQGNQPFNRFDGYNQGNDPQRQGFPPNQQPFNRFDGNHGPNQNSMGPRDNSEMSSYPFPQNGPPFMHDGPPGGGLVAMIGGLHLEKMNCDRVFSLFCLYGNVLKVKFMKTIPGTAFVEMTEEFGVKRAVSFLNMVEIFGKTVSVCVSKQHSVVPSHIFQLRDGTSSYKEFGMTKLNRFTITTQPSKNLMQPPSCVVRYYNVPLNTSESNLRKLCEEQKVPKFIKHKAFDPRPPMKSASGLLEWKTKTEAIEALIVLNHYQIKVPHTLNPYTLKMSFSPSPHL